MRSLGDRARRGGVSAAALWAAACATCALPVSAQVLPGSDPYTPYGSPVQQQGSNSGQNSQSNQQSQTSDTTSQPLQSQQIQPAQIGNSTQGSSSGGDMLSASQQLRNSPYDRSGLLLTETRIKPPAKPSEFESYVEQRLGRRLPRFGADLLVPAQRDFSTPATASVPADYILNVGDTVTISLTGSVEGSVDREIDTDGKIFLEKVGSVRLAGVRYGDLREVISAAVGRQYRGYTVTVGIQRLRGIRVYVTGFANNPGAFTVTSLSTMVNAVLAAGGPSSGGSFRAVRLIRHGQLVRDFDLYDFLRGGDRSRDAVLQNEDVLFIPPVGAQVAVFGSVNDEAIFELRPGETVADVLRFAGGANALADPSRAMLYRADDADTIGVREVAANDWAATGAKGADLVQLLSQGSLVRPLERQSAVVRIEGEVQHPGNYYVPAGTTLGQVLARAGGTTSRAFVYGSRIERLSVKQQQRQSFRDAINQLELSLASAPLTNSGLNTDAGQQQVQQTAAKDVLARLRAAEPDGRLVVDVPIDGAALPSDLVVENNDRIVIPTRPVTVGVFGSVYRPASFLLTDATRPLRVRDYVEKAGGTLRSADRGQIFVVRANGAVISHRAGAMATRVYPGDVVFVPVKASNSSFWTKLRDISSIVFQFGLSAAAIAAISD